MFFCVRIQMQCGSSSVVERQLPKLNVAGSNPVSRSKAKIPSTKVGGIFALDCFDLKL